MRFFLTQAAPRLVNRFSCVLILVSSFALTGCAKFGLDCPNVATDQKSSFMAPAREFPLQIRADDRFTETERESIRQAVALWNEHGQRVMGQDVFAVQFAPVGTLAGDKLDGCGLADREGSRGFVLWREDASSQWSSFGFESRTPAITLRCHAGEDLIKQTVLINTGLIQPVQLSSIVLHELGHTIGLGHSCVEGSGADSYKGCTGINREHPYRIAVMYPSLWVRSVPSATSPDFDQIDGYLKSGGTVFATSGSVATAEVKSSLRDNDLERASCVLSL